MLYRDEVGHLQTGGALAVVGGIAGAVCESVAGLMLKPTAASAA